MFRFGLVFYRYAGNLNVQSFFEQPCLASVSGLPRSRVSISPWTRGGSCLEVATTGDDPKTHQLSFATASLWRGRVEARIQLRGVGHGYKSP